MSLMRQSSMAIRLAVLAAVAVVIVLLVVLLAGGGSDKSADNGKPAASKSALRGVPQSGISLGAADAPVTMVEFADLQCPFCAEYHRNVFPTLLKSYVRTGKVRLELRLLRFLGPDSDRLARVAAAASKQDRMWQFVGLAYDRQGAENSGYATDDFINSLAADAGVPKADAGAAAERLIREGEQAARAAKVQSTPSFLIGPTGGALHHFQPSDLQPDAFIPEIEKELRQ
ncbi:MAG TPA: thioredoxin domain-containing protein [Thermoleophilaceae bacterium]|nr:thioredoxin domain-containing protein [Thermoleophilaceae bacterium]